MKPYTEDEVNAAIARVETAKQNFPKGFRFLDELNLTPYMAFVGYAMVNADAHAVRLAGQQRAEVYMAAWLNGLSIGVALGEGRAERNARLVALYQEYASPDLTRLVEDEEKRKRERD